MGYHVEFVDLVLDYLATQAMLYEFGFVVSAHHLEMGVVSVAYVEHTTEPIR